MGYIGNRPTAVPLTSADIQDGVITAADLGANSVDSSELVDGSIDTSHLGATQVTGAKLNTDVISAQTELASAPADTDEFMVSDAGVLKRIDYSLIKGSTNHFVRTGYFDTAATSISMTDCFSSSYSQYVIYASISNTATDNTFVKLRFLDGSDAVQTNNRNWSIIYTYANSATPTVYTQGEDTASGDFIRLSVGDDINSANTFIIQMTRWGDSGPEAQIKFETASEDWVGTKSQNIMGSARWDSANIYGVNFVNNAGTSITGKGACYGVKYD